MFLVRGGFESLLLREIEMCPKRKKPHCWGSYHLMAGYVRVSTNTYAYGIRRGFALLVTDVAL